ncbi:hypothetical protein LZ023_38450 (plasmid) [Pseudomonas silvicola]|nr:hypothetical protein LZ023_38450 [Pseudomonas silvicola]
MFGDSLSDSGNIGRFTADGAQHPLYDEILAAHLGENLQPSDLGGSNYAQGGAVAVPKLDPDLNTQDQLAAICNPQVDALIATACTFIGSVQTILPPPSPIRSPHVKPSATAQFLRLPRSNATGCAGAVIVPNVPQLGLTPYMVQIVLSTFGTSAMVAAFQSLDNAATPDAAARQQAVKAFTAAAGQISIPLRYGMCVGTTTVRCMANIARRSPHFLMANQQEEAQLAALKGNIVREICRTV